MPDPKRTQAAYKQWITRRERYGPSGRSYYKRAKKHRLRRP